MSHYFKEDKNLGHDIKTKEVNLNDMTFRFFTDRGVFSKEKLDFGTRVLLKNIQVKPESKKMIDMGCGYGPIGIYLAKNHPNAHIYMYDVNLRALHLAQRNCEINHVSNTTVQESFLFEAVDFKVDLILTNPPIRAGKDVIFKLYEQSYEHLKKGGRFYCVIQKKQGAPSTFKKLESIYSNCSIIAKEKGYWILLSVKD